MFEEKFPGVSVDQNVIDVHLGIIGAPGIGQEAATENLAKIYQETLYPVLEKLTRSGQLIEVASEKFPDDDGEELLKPDLYLVHTRLYEEVANRGKKIKIKIQKDDARHGTYSAAGWVRVRLTVPEADELTRTLRVLRKSGQGWFGSLFGSTDDGLDEDHNILYVYRKTEARELVRRLVRQDMISKLEESVERMMKKYFGHTEEPARPPEE